MYSKQPLSWCFTINFFYMLFMASYVRHGIPSCMCVHMGARGALLAFTVCLLECVLSTWLWEKKAHKCWRGPEKLFHVIIKWPSYQVFDKPWSTNQLAQLQVLTRVHKDRDTERLNWRLLRHESIAAKIYWIRHNEQSCKNWLQASSAFSLLLSLRVGWKLQRGERLHHCMSWTLALVMKCIHLLPEQV